MTPMSNEMRIAGDGEAFEVHANGADWRTAWHPPPVAPDGTPHGASGFCLTGVGDVVLVSHDGVRWEWPGGRPEGAESWEETFRWEMLEETCSIVRAAKLLGFCRSECLTGPEIGLILVRSVWRGEVDVMPWEPKFEIGYRRIVPAQALLSTMHIDPGWEPVIRRAASEAGPPLLA
jgi:hypothetical protein